MISRQAFAVSLIGVVFFLSVGLSGLFWPERIQTYALEHSTSRLQQKVNPFLAWMDDAIWDVTVFTKNRERLLDGDIAEAFFQAVLQQARERSLLSDEHFTVDGTLLEAWASVKSYQRKDAKNAVPPDDPGNATVDFHGEKRSNETHASKTDPDAKMARKGKGKEAKLSYNGNLLVENRNGLIVNTEVFEANGTAERDAALVMLEQIPGTKQITVGGDKGYDTADFVAECRNLKVTPHVAQNLERPGGSALDARTTQHAGYAISQRKRKRVEECFGWLKTNRAIAEGSASWNLQGGMGLHLCRGNQCPGRYSRWPVFR